MPPIPTQESQTPPGMSVLQLLERWSAFEPDRCSHVAGIFILRGWSISYDADISDKLTLAEIQNAVQEAVESHNWNWFLARIVIEEGIYFKARISIPTAPDTLNRSLATKLSSSSAAYALLLAYIDALETVRDADEQISAIPAAGEARLQLDSPPLYPD